MYKLILFANTTLKGQKEGLYDITYHFVFCITGFDTFLLSGLRETIRIPSSFPIRNSLSFLPAGKKSMDGSKVSNRPDLR